jgi:hypothetical protein
MDKKDVVDAYITIRKENSTIPDDVLDLMKNAAVSRLESIFTIKTLREKFFAECVDRMHNGGVPYNKVNLAPHDMFEWFKLHFALTSDEFYWKQKYEELCNAIAKEPHV